MIDESTLLAARVRRAHISQLIDESTDPDDLKKYVGRLEDSYLGTIAHLTSQISVPTEDEDFEIARDLGADTATSPIVEYLVRINPTHLTDEERDELEFRAIVAISDIYRLFRCRN